MILCFGRKGGKPTITKNHPTAVLQSQHQTETTFCQRGTQQAWNDSSFHTATADMPIFLGPRSASSPCPSLKGCRKMFQTKILSLEDANTGMCNFLDIKSRSKGAGNYIEQCHRMTAMGQQRHQGKGATQRVLARAI